MRRKLSEVSAVEFNDAHDVEILGFMTWYSIGEQIISREQLRNLVEESGLDEGYMPAEIRLPDAFRKATKAVETKKEISEEGIFHKFLVREVTSSNKIVQRNIVREVINSKGKKLSYSPEEAVMILDKETGTMSVGGIEGIPQELAQEALRLFAIYSTSYDSRALRSMAYNIIRSMSPTALKSTGGIYFIPAKYQEKLLCLKAFVEGLEKGEVIIIPLIDTKDSLDLIRNKAMDQISNSFKELEAAIDDPDITAADIIKIKDDVELSLRVIEDYKEILLGDIERMEFTVGSINKMLRTLSSRKKDRKKKSGGRQLQFN